MDNIEVDNPKSLKEGWIFIKKLLDYGVANYTCSSILQILPKNYLAGLLRFSSSVEDRRFFLKTFFGRFFESPGTGVSFETFLISSRNSIFKNLYKAI